LLLGKLLDCLLRGIAIFLITPSLKTVGNALFAGAGVLAAI